MTDAESTPRPERIGIFGGSFDPVHVGHVRAAEEAARRLDLARVILVPAGVQPLKPEGTVATGADRLAMLRLAVEGHERLAVSDVEVTRPGPSYTVDTVRAMRGGLVEGIGAAAELVLLVGTDVLRELPGWRDAARLVELAPPAILRRPGEPEPDLAELARAMPANVSRQVTREIVTLETGVEVSATEVRRRFRAGESVAELVHPAVERYIRERGLYGAARE